VLPPFAVKVVLLPEQILEGVAEAVIVINEFTVTATVAVAEQVPLVPVTVYVVVEAGVTVMDVPFPPVLQL
jgi:hypothetical protein